MCSQGATFGIQTREGRHGGLKFVHCSCVRMYLYASATPLCPHCLRTSSFKLLVFRSRSAANNAAPAAFVKAKKMFRTGTTCSNNAAVPMPLIGYRKSQSGSIGKWLHLRISTTALLDLLVLLLLAELFELKVSGCMSGSACSLDATGRL